MCRSRRSGDHDDMHRFIALLLLLVLPSAGANAVQRVDTKGSTVLEVASTLKNGEFVWAPELAPTGPTLLIINLETQRAVLFRNGIPIAASTLSTGRPGYETPTGVFTILQKQVEHYSSKYDNAPMPYMQRLTWKGVALHAGYLPGYPASHGCIRLPKEFARLLYGATTLGMTVVVTRIPSTLRPADQIPIASKPSPETDLADAAFEWHPARSPYGVTTVIVSVADQRAIVLRNGKMIGSSPVRVTGTADSGWAYLLHHSSKDGRHWLKLRFGGDATGGMEVSPEEVKRFQMPEAFREAVIQIIRPGSIILVTPEPLRLGHAGEPLTLIEGGETVTD